jgi:hypothetical protein
MTSIVTITTPPTAHTRPLPVDLVDGPAGLLYLLPHAPLTLADCEALSAVLAARAAAVRQQPPHLGTRPLSAASQGHGHSAASGVGSDGG